MAKPQTVAERIRDIDQAIRAVSAAGMAFERAGDALRRFGAAGAAADHVFAEAAEGQDRGAPRIGMTVGGSHE